MQWIPGSVSLGVKRQGRDADDSPPSSTEINNDGAIPPLRIRLPGVVLYLLPVLISSKALYTYFALNLITK
jgi:hypothetical protein